MVAFADSILEDIGLTLRRRAEHSIGLLENWHAAIIEHWAHGASGWAPPVAATVLSRSRLDRQASLCGCLRLWLDLPAEQSDGRLILAWANLGSVVEGTLKFFLSVFAHDYAQNPKLTRKGKALDPDELLFEALRLFFRDNVWIDSDTYWDAWLQCVQRRRNAIHAYQDTEIGTHDEFLSAVIGYRQFASHLNQRIPWWSFEQVPPI